MKKLAIVTVAVLALGLAGCNKNNADNSAANETAVENNADLDVNAATNDSVNAADAALNATDNSVATACTALDAAHAPAANATTNQQAFRSSFEGPLPRGGPFFMRHPRDRRA